MLSRTLMVRCAGRVRSIHPEANRRASAQAKVEEFSKRQQMLQKLIDQRNEGVESTSTNKPAPSSTLTVLNSLQDSVQLTSSVSLSAAQLWNSSRVLRERPEMRQQTRTFVVGGSRTIQRIWKRYRIRPNVVYVPESMEEVPAWCHDELLPSVVVRCPAADINRKLLSAELNDGFAAEFPMPAMPPAEDFLDEPFAASKSVENSNHVKRLEAMLVLFKVMIPSNVGSLCRSAVDCGFDSVTLVDCADVFSEKVVRASEGAVLSPRLRLYPIKSSSLPQGSGGCVPFLQQAALKHQLLPVFAVPSQDAEPIFSVAKRFHAINFKRPAHQPRLGTMLVMGSEATGLQSFESQWTMPYQAAMIPMPNTAVTSMNVAAAGSIFMRYLRPKAEDEFRTLAEKHQQISAEKAPEQLP